MSKNLQNEADKLRAEIVEAKAKVKTLTNQIKHREEQLQDVLQRNVTRLSTRQESDCVTPEHFAASLPPPITTRHGYVCVSESLRRDIQLALEADLLPMGAKFYVRESSYSPIIAVEFAGWPSGIFSNEYIAVMMDNVLAQRGLLTSNPTRWAPAPKELLQDPRLTAEINAAYAIIKACADRRVTEVMAEEPENYYGPMHYSVEIHYLRLVAAAERNLRVELDPTYAEFLHRAHLAAERLGSRVVRQVCGEGGVDLCRNEFELEELVKLDAEAAGRPVTVKYVRRNRRWIITERETP